MEVSELKEEIKGKECDACRQEPRIAWIDGWKTRCGCYPRAPRLIPIPRIEGERLARMVEQQHPEAAEAIAESLVPATIVSSPAPIIPMTPAQFDAEQALIKHVITQMVLGVHYGAIFKGAKRNLWEPGAEYLRRAARINWGHTIIGSYENYEDGEFRYTVEAYQVVGYAPNGVALKGPSWTASAWSEEERFKGKPGKPGTAKEDLPDFVLDRAIKRAFVNMIRNVVGVSGDFMAAYEGVSVDVVPESTQATPEAREPQGQDNPAVEGHPWLTTCPDHNMEWFKSGNMRTFGHQSEDKEWCNRPNVIDRLCKEVNAASYEALGWDEATVKKWLKDTYGGTWSTLKEDAKIAAMQKMADLAASTSVAV